MFKKFLENCKKPRGLLGKIVLIGMNNGHGPLVNWALDTYEFDNVNRILDVGCGGGANIKRMLKRYPEAIVEGVDYAPDCVGACKKKYQNELGKSVNIYEGNVMELPFEDSSYDLVTGFETIYFWPSPEAGLREINRVLKVGGHVVIATEMADPDKGKIYTDNCEGMIIYTPEQLQTFFTKANFKDVRCTRKGKWAVVNGRK